MNNEIPKKIIWYSFEWGREIVGGMDEDDVPYIRKDIVDELYSALLVAEQSVGDLESLEIVRAALDKVKDLL